MAETTAPGFFGKVPARGDFLSRRVPPSIAAEWESWLQRLTATVRDAGQPGWQDAWLTAPLWHFVLGRELAPPYGAAGVLIASADRVGRLFPFTVIGAADPSAAAGADGWPRTAEVLALSALEDAFDPATLDAALQALGPPVVSSGPTGPVGLSALSLEQDWPAETAAGPGPAQSAWWTRGSDRVGPTRLQADGLPDARLAEAMILGQNAPSSGAR